MCRSLLERFPSFFLFLLSSKVPTHKFITSIIGRGSSGGLSLTGRYSVSLFILTGFCFILNEAGHEGQVLKGDGGGDGTAGVGWLCRRAWGVEETAKVALCYGHLRPSKRALCGTTFRCAYSHYVEGMAKGIPGYGMEADVWLGHSHCWCHGSWLGRFMVY